MARRRTWAGWAGLVIAVLPASPAPGQAGFGGLDFSGFSAFGSSSGAGVGAGAGVALGPRQDARRTPPAPAAVPSPPPDALPAAAPPPDPVLDTPLLGSPLLVPDSLAAPRDDSARIPAPAPQAPAAPAPPGYGSEALGYGPPVPAAPSPAAVAGPQFGDPRGAAPLDAVVPAVPAPAFDDDLPPPLPRLPDGPDRRTYLSGILGADFGTLEVGQGPNASAPLFTAGGAAGMAFERETGWFRGEFEARYRDPVAETFAGPVLGEVSVSASDGWSTMVNGWRDFEITDRVGAYLGGGIGGAGYRVVFDGEYAALGARMSGSTRLVGFAWQAGTGATWLVNDRLALDLGYRFLAVEGGNAQIIVDAPPISFSDAVGTRYGASELLFTVRVFEPFRGRRD